MLTALALSSQPQTEKVYSFRALIELEKSSTVSDEVKVAEWQAFVERTEKQLAYARRAVGRWQDAAKKRVLDLALTLESNPTSEPTEKEAAWRRVAAAFSETSPDGRRAAERASHWHGVRTADLAQNARRVEDEGQSKVARISAWQKVVAYAERGPTRDMARRRIQALQEQLMREAEALDAVEQVDAETKLQAWRAVLDGAPSREQIARARARIAALSPQ